MSNLHVLPNFYPNLSIFLHGYICHIRDISQLCLRWWTFQVICEPSPNSEQPLATRPTQHFLMRVTQILTWSDTTMGFVKIFSKTDPGQNRNSSGATSSSGANTLCDCKATNCQRRRGVVLFGLSSIFCSLQLLVDYNYDLKTAAMWYRQDYLRALKAQKRNKSL